MFPISQSDNPINAAGTGAALSMLEAAGIVHKAVGVDLVEVDGKFVLHTPTSYWREHSGVRLGYSVRTLLMALKASALPNL